jgi:hypothetical protein
MIIVGVVALMAVVQAQTSTSLAGVLEAVSCDPDAFATCATAPIRLYLAKDGNLALMSRSPGEKPVRFILHVVPRVSKDTAERIGPLPPKDGWKTIGPKAKRRGHH